MDANCRKIRTQPGWANAVGIGRRHAGGSKAGFNDKTWLDMVGIPFRASARYEKFRRADFGHMQVQVTYDDPETLTKPLTMSVAVNYAVDADMLEYVCNEDERDTEHLVGTAKVEGTSQPGRAGQIRGRIQVSRRSHCLQGLLRSGSNRKRAKGTTVHEGFSTGPQSETSFDSTAGRLSSPGFEWPSYALILSAAEGDSRYDRTH